MDSRQQQINNLIERGIEARLFQRMERQPRNMPDWTPEKWQKAQADSLAVRKRLQQILGIKGDEK